MKSLDIRNILLRCPKTLLWHRYRQPVTVFVARNLNEVCDVVSNVEKTVNDYNLHAVGFVSYEASPAFNSDMIVCEAKGFPFACFALFDKYEIVGQVRSSSATEKPFWSCAISLQDYMKKVIAIKELIESGDIYQINYTTQFRAEIDDFEQFFYDFVSDEPYACFIDTSEFQVLSASPELFFELEENVIRSKPMKGTAPRFDSLKLDNESRDQLAESEKNKAENLMITDMMRNDLSKIAKLGSVSVRNAFQVEKYSTVWQMTSTIEAYTKASLLEIFRALFPCSSITGAPKNKSMEYIKFFEKKPRGIYTGAIGIIRPNRKAVFSVAIRTALRDQATGGTVYGSGGGIVWDSKPVPEFKEVNYKTRILKTVRNDHNFHLFETMQLQHKLGIKFLNRHLKRLEMAANFFGINFSKKKVLEFLEAEIISQGIEYDARLKLALDIYGKFSLFCSKIKKPFEKDQVVQFAVTPVDKKDIYLYYKTNFRDNYDRAQSEVPSDIEPILFNQDFQVTETNISNIVYEKDGELFTPPVECGLLPGVLRDKLLEDSTIREKAITKNDLLKVNNLFLINSLRGWRNARFLKNPVIE
ncbi:MAG: chorismate-binding protein [Pseudomonadota bacterium]|nr:chorismate-binding protein [Pseudomonadota bacterium]